MNRLRILALVLGLSLLVSEAPRGAGASQVDPVHPVHPTATAETGDTGGKIFGRAPDPAKTRHYYVAAEPQVWDYAPRGADAVCGRPVPEYLATQHTGAKLRYVQYTDATFQARVFDTPRLGILGPVLRGVVGEYLVVTFANHTSRPLSMHPHGVLYDKDSEGAYYQPDPGLGAAVAPGATFTYVWYLDPQSGPRPDEPSSKAWLYHSHVNGDEETALGLVGFIVVTDPHRARPDGTPSDVDREMAALFMIFDESGLDEAEKEKAEYKDIPGGPPVKSWAEVQELIERGSRYSINGYVFGNLPGLEMVEGERVRWYLFGLGSEHDFHTAHWHGLRVLEEGRRMTDVVELLPASMKVADLRADNPGTWLFHCHVAEHMTEGMFARMVVRPRSGGASGTDALEAPFFGLPASQVSLRMKDAETARGASGAEVKLGGAVTVTEAFSVFAEPVTVRIGDMGATFSLDRSGVAKTADGSFRVGNASRYGVVYGGVMEFEATLDGDAWLRAAKTAAAGASAARPAALVVPVTIQVGRAVHTVRVKLSVPST
jgi:FtsP/CotA-like multicopper oxidase with cupredoxin domain